MPTTTIFTIADERFLPGLAGLINSLRATGFRGPIVVGSPGPIAALDGIENVRVALLADDQLWLAFQKPALILSEASESFVFFDADIVVADPNLLVRLDTMANIGPVLAVEAMVAPTDVRRHRWAERLGTPQARSDAWAYFNGGFAAGRLSRDRRFLEGWDATVRRAVAGVTGYSEDPDFPYGDQDALNAFMQTEDMRVVSLQPPDWWSAAAPLNPFLHVGAFPDPTFYHATGSKPWNLKAVPSRGPSPYERRWFRHVVTAPHPLHVTCRLPAPVKNWLSGSWSGRATSRTQRLKERLLGD